MKLILSKTFFSSEIRTLKLRFSVGSQSLHFDGSSENILSEQVTNCPSGDKGLITHTAYRGPRINELAYHRVTACVGIDAHKVYKHTGENLHLATSFANEMSLNPRQGELAGW